ncbi:glycoside hydrolase superfamily [Hypoxylon trugodes]|uniref:glycoside hydrolase superfamily n=1 Tax=Hypoxylon trugodes TaxID=326681 RepID=UPI00219A9CDA|nr:glycoside hydrolase superfamily [Hypoxylon trugodes]KAI1383798.1 glycoside hydrolase superfamily [Hypoxylon trugodes]
MNGLCRKNGWFGKEPWWKDATFYQVYPASFKDSNGDGWGDIPGLISKIDYLYELGIDVVWLSPVFESPQADMGYDVSDYQKIYAPYGTVEDVDALIKACHQRNMKLILDLVVNHTSIEHEWFKESRSSKINPKRDWYIWKPPRYNSRGERVPPTNWRGYFAGPTWTWDEYTQEYYLHLYAPEQPDLNWESEACRKAIYDNTMRFWLERGVDGFRIDTVNKYSKRTEYIDAPITDPNSPSQAAPEMWCNGPRIHEFIREMRSKVLEPYGAISVGELSNTPHPDQVLPYISAAARELDMVFEFSMIRLGIGGMFGSKYIYSPFTLSQLKAVVAKWQTFIEGTDGWTTVFCENHDNGRAVSRFGNCSTPQLWQASAKTLALWQATMTGTLFIYQGQEIGMANMPAGWDIDEYKDVEGLNFYAEALASKDEKRIADTIHGLHILARDHSRIPFQWDDSPNAGFAEKGVKTWMRVHDEYRDINAAKQIADNDSILNFYKMILKLRKQYKDVFVFGTFRLLDPQDEAIFAYVKESPPSVADAQPQTNGTANHSQTRTKRIAVVVLNFSIDDQDCPDIEKVLGEGRARLLVSTQYGEGGDVGMSLDKDVGLPTLKPWEGRVNLEGKGIEYLANIFFVLVSYAAAAASGPKQTPAEAAAPQPPEVISSESASTASLVDVDTPSVRTVPSDFMEQDVKTETQATRQELEDAAERARAEAHLAKKRGAGRARKADTILTKWFSDLSDGTTTTLAISNLAAIVGLSSYLGYKAWGQYEHGRLGWKSVGIGAGIVAGVGIIEGFLGRYLYKGKKRQS